MRVLLTLCLCSCALAAPASIAPRKPQPPPSRFSNPVDAFVESWFGRNGIGWPGAVSDAVFARRACFDLWGLPPTPEQLNVPDRPALIKSLLANRRNYSEHWISFWNDLLRNDEGVVYHGTRESITEWLLEALATNLPYDRMVSALLHPVGPKDPRGFLIGVNWRGDVSASQAPAMQAAQNSAQVFLGVNLKCNSCHDSFISKWKLADAYGLASFFSEAPLEMHRCDVKTGVTAAPAFLYPELGGVDPGASPEERRAAAARLFTARENGRFARTFVNRVWARLFGAGIVPVVDDLDRPAWNADLLDWLAEDFAGHGYDIQHLLERIMTSETYRLPAVAEPKAGGKSVFRGPRLRRLTAEQFLDSVSAVTGEWRVLQPKTAGAGKYVRDWRLKSTPLARALGRPIRDQVFTERNQDATTLQMLEIVNGETLHGLIRRGAERMLGKSRQAPLNLFDSGVVSTSPVSVDIDISGAQKLWLLIEDADSYDPARTVAGWAGLDRGNGSLKFKGQESRPALVSPVPSQTVIDVAGQTRFRATVGVDESSLRSDISPRVRFFIFREAPDRERLVRVEGGTPVPRDSRPLDLGRVYRHALARDPSPAERRIAAEAPLEDFLWAMFASPEFQYIR